MNKSEIIRLGKGCCSKGEGEGVKVFKVGIHGELHIGREEELWIRLQAPLEMKEWELRMPFHSHENEEEKDGGERKDFEWRYLPFS
jgi:hypothetical protein